MNKSWKYQRKTKNKQIQCIHLQRMNYKRVKYEHFMFFWAIFIFCHVFQLCKIYLKFKCSDERYSVKLIWTNVGSDTAIES